MSLAIASKPAKKEKSPTPAHMRRLSDETAEIIRRHQAGEIDGDEAGRQLNDLKRRYRTFLDRLIG
ncbi:MAG: hypothetical protein J0I42_20260 [Bosea sp.]|uniref:hypothetical protein n=1 Tax=Bosea sp. (in: a-proteobacteria) TaxID=1871050 RepID=UPI001AD09D10|nr:hypothetical protein [Bosea sp. (in: a-proteobacteria)]MBN9454277.1 hypothetical protein [Bosea sp. (in: a-proteobacteria)]